METKDQKTLKRLFSSVCPCAVQHTGYPCGSCFFAISDKFRHKHWLSVLYVRGDYKLEDTKQTKDEVLKNMKDVERILFAQWVINDNKRNREARRKAKS